MFRPTSASNEAEIEVTGTTGVHSYPVTAWRGGLVGLMFVLAFTLFWVAFSPLLAAIHTDKIALSLLTNFVRCYL